MRAWMLLALTLTCSALGLLAVSITLVGADERALTSENTRLALWRMELVMSRILASESVRPPLDGVQRFEPPPGTLLHFDLPPSGQLLTAQPASFERLAAVQPYLGRLVTQRPAVALQNNNAAEFSRRALLANGNFPREREQPLAPIWVDDALFLVRRDRLADGFHTRGVWLDWPILRQQLLREVGDLLPEAELVAARNPSADAVLLASMPVELRPGRPAKLVDGSRTPVRHVLMAAWLAWALVAVALVSLVHGARSLAARRESFVSAVTHELRTPLTTFKLYAEMLEGGMVAPDQQGGYLARLRQEADRLGYLVENVLAWAQIERGRRRKPLEEVLCGDLLEQIVPRLTQRAELGAFSLDVGSVPALRVRADRFSVEQVLFNLVDNACKYAAHATTRRIALTCEVQTSGHLALTVADEGPGVAADVESKLFEPMQKSAVEAANGAHGIGLGLALSRQLARSMGGELSSRPDARRGAAFVLTLRIAGAETA
ncbi:MAG: HAMP domain-containing histidine kinase [Archangium sp.]|nr:HAMP domain-containing histidine kinase [Archangium sp.]